MALAAWALLAWRAGSLAHDLADFGSTLTTHVSLTVCAIAGTAAAIALHDSTFSASGSDASGYLSQAVMLAHREFERREPLLAAATWPNAAASAAPLGWLETSGDTQVPTYPIGLPLLMAPLHAAGGIIAACLLGPVSLGLGVWAAARLAHRVAGATAAIVAAAWFATSPVALVSAMQPMSDVPATTAWLLCWVAVVAEGPHAALAGLAAAIAVLIRPNLAPLAAVPALYLLIAESRQPLAVRVRRTALFGVPVVVAGLMVAYFQWRWFGSPLRSGYGSAGEIYSSVNVTPNATLYTRWLVETHGPWLLVGLLGFVVPSRSIKWLLAFACLVIVAYLVYAVFEVWTYLRFLLPALAILMVAGAAAIAIVLAKFPAWVQSPALLVILLAVASNGIASARELGVFRLEARHARASLAGRYLEPNVSVRGVIVSGEQSGALRYYTNRPILRWEVMTPDAFAMAAGQLVRDGHDLWIALDDWEEEIFRRKFSTTPAGSLDWPPLVEAGSEIRLRAWRLRDRERFMRGDRVFFDRLP